MSHPEISYPGHDELRAVEQMTRYNRFIAGLFARSLPKQPTAKVLDFGAGIGTISMQFRQATGIAPLALEIDAGQRHILQSRQLTTISHITELADASIDLCISSNVLEHIEDDAAVLRDIYAKLKPGGALTLWLPAFPLLWTKMDESIGHFRRYTRAGLVKTLQDAGFVVEQSRYYDCAGFMLALCWRVGGGNQAKPAQLRFFDRYIFPISNLLDPLTGWLFGKNVFVVARRKA